MLAFNRSAAVEVRRRLQALVGNDAAGVTVLTYHAMALRLTGISLGALAQADQTPDFDAVLRQAVDLLEGRVVAGSDPDELRDRLLEGCPSTCRSPTVGARWSGSPSARACLCR